MPVRVPAGLPAIEALGDENIRLIEAGEARPAGTRPIRLAVLNLMPLKKMTEIDLLRMLSNTPLEIDLDLVTVDGHLSRNTPPEHIEAFYKRFSAIRDRDYDGLIITGAPLEKIDFEDVDYWDELGGIFTWARSRVRSTLYVCWAAMAGLYYHYGVPKHVFEPKISGVFKHRVLDSKNPILRGFDDEFYVPQSRFSEVRRADIERHEELEIISESDESGVYIVMGRGGREFYITGHSEYSPMTLDFEYRRDLAKGMNPDVPKNYYEDDNPSKRPVVRWRAHATLLYTNWLNNFVYHNSPYAAN